jgi:hypothetical protein
MYVKRSTAIALSVLLLAGSIAPALATSPPHQVLIAQLDGVLSPGDAVLGIVGGVIWVITTAGEVIGYVTNSIGEVVQTIFPASYEGMTRQECEALPGYIDWHPYKRWVRGRYVEQPTGTCYTVD